MPRKPAPPEMITPAEAASRLGVDANYIRMEMRKGAFPVGWAYNPTGTKWVYCIPRAAFDNLMAGKSNLNMDELASMVAAKVIEQLQHMPVMATASGRN